MKFSHLIIILLLKFSLSNNTQGIAQYITSGTNNKNELSIIIDDLFTKKEAIVQEDKISIQNMQPMDKISILDVHCPKVGLSYKYRFGKAGIRTKLNYGYINKDYDYAESNDYKSNLEMSDAIYTLGMELYSDLNRCQLFYGIEGFYNRKHSIYEYNSRYSFSYSTNTTYISTNEVAYNGKGISPLLGFKVFISENFSLSTEIKLMWEFSKTTEELKIDYTTIVPPSPVGYQELYIVPDDFRDKSTSKGINIYLGPQGTLSFNIHF